MESRDETHPRGLLLPNLCAAAAVLFLSLIAVLLALTLELFARGLAGFDWADFGRTAMFILWNMLIVAPLLCWLRPRIARRHVALGAVLAYGVILLVCLVTSLACQLLLHEGLADAERPLRLQRLARDLIIAAILGGAALRYFHLQGRLLARQRSELNARIDALQARIRPHFLFNSMNIIASLIASAPAKAERAVEDLAGLFRASLSQADRTVPLAEELELCERYLRLESLRLGERLRIERLIAAVPDAARVPALCIQPLLENAVYHGVQRLPAGGLLQLRVTVAAGRIRVEVRNPVPDVAGPGTGGGIALANIRARLRAIYGPAARLATQAVGGEFVACLELPWVPA